jgi:hypothetical protein
MLLFGCKTLQLDIGGLGIVYPNLLKAVHDNIRSDFALGMGDPVGNHVTLDRFIRLVQHELHLLAPDTGRQWSIDRHITHLQLGRAMGQNKVHNRSE